MDHEVTANVQIENGKYRIETRSDGSILSYRYGEIWLNMTHLPGSNMMFALVHEVEELNKKLAIAKNRENAVQELALLNSCGCIRDQFSEFEIQQFVNNKEKK